MAAHTGSGTQGEMPEQFELRISDGDCRGDLRPSLIERLMHFCAGRASDAERSVGAGGRRSIWARVRPKTQTKAVHTKRHGEASIVTCVLAGIVCGVMMFVFCSVFAQMLFGQNPLLQPAVPLGVGLQSMTALIGAITFARFSGCHAVLAGPDINPLVFLAEAAASISEDLLALCQLSERSDLSADGSHSSSSGSSGGEPLAEWSACGEEVTRLAVPTVLVASMIGTLLVGIFFLLLGKLRLTVVVGFIPANVIAGFLSCIGWKVLKASMQIACPISETKPFKFRYYFYYFGSWETSWRYFLPALPVGIPLYLLKRYHRGQPTINFSLFILVPTLVFYAAVLGSGSSLEDARANGWLFPKATENVPFWRGWETMYGGIARENISWSSLATCVPTWVVMLLITSLDNMLKLASTESSLAIDFDYNHEMKVGGATTILTALLCGSPAYGQTKFNVLSFGMTHSTERSLPALVCGAFCGVLFFSGLPLIDYLPRFMLAGLLLFSAVGFLMENLVDTRHRFNRLNFLAVWAVFLINVLGGEYLSQFGLLIAIGAGLIWGLVAFAVHFARKSDLGGGSQTISGELHCSTAYRSVAQEAKLGVLGVWYTIFRSQGTYIFFGTASLLHRRFQAHVARDALRLRCERTKMLIIDLSEVYGIDATAGTIFNKVTRLSRKCDITIVWAGMAETVEDELKRSGVLAKDSHSFASLDKAEKWVEDELLKHVHSLALKWLVDKTCKMVYNRALLHDALTATHSINDGHIGPSQLLKWSRRQFVKKGTLILTEGSPDDGLYLLYRGLVDVSEGVAQEAHTIYPGALFNEHVMYSPPYTGALFSAVAVEDCVLLRIGHEQRMRMQYQSPNDAYALLLTAFKQVEMRNPARRHHTWLEQAGVPTYQRRPSLDCCTTVNISSSRASCVAAGLARVELPAVSDVSHSTEACDAAAPPVTWPTSSPDVSGQESSSCRETSSGSDRNSTYQMPPPSPAPLVSPGGVQRRRTVKNSDMARRMTDRDLSMRQLARRVEREAVNEARGRQRVSCFDAVPEASSDTPLREQSEPISSSGSARAGPASPPSLREHSAPFENRAASPKQRATRHAHIDESVPSPAVKSPTLLRRTLSGGAPSLRRLNSKEPMGESASSGDGDGSGAGPSSPLASFRRREAHDHYHREAKLVDKELLHGCDYRVPLTAAQHSHYSLIYELNDHSGLGHLKVSELATFMDTLGHGVPVEELEQMMHELGIVEDADGTISKEGYLEFMRRSFISDLPASKMPFVHELFVAEASKRLSVQTGAADSSEDLVSPSARAVSVKRSAARPAATPLGLQSALERAGAAGQVAAMDGAAAYLKSEDLGELVQHPHTAAGESEAPASPRPLATPPGRRWSAEKPVHENSPGPLFSPHPHAHAIAHLERGELLVSKAQAAMTLQTLGFVLDELSLSELFDELDADGEPSDTCPKPVSQRCPSCLMPHAPFPLTGDGLLSEAEYITCIGMLKRDLLETMALEKSFLSFRQAATGDASARASPSRRSEDDDDDDNHRVYASDLVGALGVTLQEAEEMIFIADLKDDQAIDFTEFKQVVVNWSG